MIPKQTLYGLDFEVRSLPELDTAFVPLPLFYCAHAQLAKQPFAVALHRPGGQVSVYETQLIGTENYRTTDIYYLEQLVKTLLCLFGGFRVQLCGNADVALPVQRIFAESPTRELDRNFFTQVYKTSFTVEVLPYANRPAPHESTERVGGHFEGCRIGFDAGGSDRKVCAAIDGKTVYTEEVEWFPRENSDPQYHYEGIVAALRTAAAKMPRVDAIGVSSAGVFVDNQVRVSYLFDKVPPHLQREKVEDIFIRAAHAACPGAALHVLNDGEVAALAGAMGLREGRVLGVAMGTGEGAGYVDANGGVTGWLNEPGLAPLDAQPNALRTHWSGEVGCCTEFLCQDGVLWLAQRAGIELAGAYKAARLKDVQALANAGEPRALRVFRDMGVYVGHALGLYNAFYSIGRVLMLGRVTSGAGGDVLLQRAAEVLRQDYPQCAFVPEAPDEMARRVGQSVAAASL